jgi:hypothetical protein
MPPEVDADSPDDELGSDVVDPTPDLAEGDEAIDEVVDDDQPRYTVKVNGEDLEVPVDELVKGYQRQSDYTQKTQALSQERENLATLRALERALEADPQATIKALEQLYVGTSPLAPEADDPDDNDPFARELHELKLWKEQQENQARQQAIITEADEAVRKHGLKVDKTELLEFAVQNQLLSLDAAARLYKAEAREQAQADVTNRKRSAAVVEGGRTRPTSGAAPEPRNISEAFALAKKELGIVDAANLS